MIESISSTAITLPNITQGSQAIELQTPEAEDVAKFDSILQKSQSANFDGIQANKNANNELGILDKLIETNRNYINIQKNAVDIGNLINPKETKPKAADIAIHTVENNKLRTADTIRTTLKEDGVPAIDNALKKSIAEIKELQKTKKLINQKFMEMRIWSTNMAIFSAIVKNVSTGLQTLFRSSG